MECVKHPDKYLDDIQVNNIWKSEWHYEYVS